MPDIDLFSTLFVRALPVPPPYLKWEDVVIGHINEDYTVDFVEGVSHPHKDVYLKSSRWDQVQFRNFLMDRLPSKDRRDIDKLLMRMGESNYNTYRIAFITRAFNAKDSFWLSESLEERMEDVLPKVFKEVFHKSVDFEGQEIYSPEGVNIKRYACHDGDYGILKTRLSPVMTDVESEVAVYRLSQLIGVDVCPSYFLVDKGERKSFSVFKYDFLEESIIPYRRFFDGRPVHENYYEELVKVFPEGKEGIQKMIILDFLTRQDDRHLSNFAVKVSHINGKVSFYSLYDNGRSLFFEDTESMVEESVENIPLFCTSFGPVGTYYDYILDLSKEVKFRDLINLDISKEHIYDVYRGSGIEGYRLKGSVRWTYGCLEILKTLDERKYVKIKSF